MTNVFTFFSSCIGIPGVFYLQGERGGIEGSSARVSIGQLSHSEL